MEQQANPQFAPQSTAQSQSQPQEGKKLKPPLMILGAILVFFLGMGAMYLWQNYPDLRFLKPREKSCTLEAKICPDGTTVGRTGPKCEFAPCPTIRLSPQPKIPAGWKTYLAEKVVDYFKTFKLFYPPSWKLKIEKGADPARQILTLEKEGFTINLSQVPGSQASCLFPEDLWVEGMFSRYGEYKEINKDNNLIWRRAMPEDQPPAKKIYMVCEKRQDSPYFTGTTSIGFVSLEGPTIPTLILEEFEEILGKIEIQE